MKRIIFGFIAVAIVLSSTLLHAQSPGYSNYNPQAQYAPAPVYFYPQGGWSSDGYHASTSEQGVLTGAGQLFRGVGEYNVANSIAAYNWQLARAADLRNAVAERHARATMYMSVHAAQERKHQENIKKNQAVAQFHANQRKALLAGSQLDRRTGELKWPQLLTSSQFTAERSDVQNALVERFDQRHVGVGQSDDALLDTVSAMKAKLEKHKSDFRPDDFYAARAFLDRLKNEVNSNPAQFAVSF